MQYLDPARLDSLTRGQFRAAKPYPFWNPEGVLTPEGFERLRETLPELERFQASFGVERKFGQDPHDRYSLEFEDQPDLPGPWLDFVAELRGETYMGFLRRVLGARSIELGFHWHYTPNGCSISPHCDSRRKLGSHLFYFNTADDWDPAWGGQTLVLDDGRRFDRKSSPAFEDFDGEQPVEIMGNRSALFAAGPHSWHGMHEVHCPEGKLRKVFIVVFNDTGLWRRVRRRLKGKSAAGPAGY